MKTDKKKNKCFALKNIPLTFQTYPKTSLLFCILMLFVLRFYSYGFIMGPSFGNCLGFIFMIILYFPAYIGGYILKKCGKPYFLRLSWSYTIIIAIIITLYLLILGKTNPDVGISRLRILFILSYLILLIPVFCNGIIFFLGTNTPPKTPQKTPWITICFAIPIVFICYIVVLFFILAGLYEYLESKQSDLTDYSKSSNIMDCATAIRQDYIMVVSEDGQRLKCKGLSHCTGGRYYDICLDKKGKPYTGYALYRSVGKIKRKVYYEDGKVNYDLLESYRENGQVDTRGFLQDGVIITETYSEDGEMIEQTIIKDGENDGIHRHYTTYSKSDHIIGHVDRAGNVRGLYDKVIGSVNKTVFRLVCDDNKDFIGYIDYNEFKDFEKKLLGKDTEHQIVSEDGELLGYECYWGKIAYDEDNNIIGIVVKEPNYINKYNVVVFGIDDGKVNRSRVTEYLRL